MQGAEVAEQFSHPGDLLLLVGSEAIERLAELTAFQWRSRVPEWERRDHYSAP
jgi:hypothetical protein